MNWFVGALINELGIKVTDYHGKDLQYIWVEPEGKRIVQNHTACENANGKK